MLKLVNLQFDGTEHLYQYVYVISTGWQILNFSLNLTWYYLSFLSVHNLSTSEVRGGDLKNCLRFKLKNQRFDENWGRLLL